jgi:hypothetical protein
MHLESFLHPWNETNLAMLSHALNVLLNLVCKYFIDAFLHLCSSRKLTYSFHFYCVLIQFCYMDFTEWILFCGIFSGTLALMFPQRFGRI